LDKFNSLLFFLIHRQHLASLQEANKSIRSKIRNIRKKMMLTEHKTMQVGFDVKEQNRILQTEQTKLSAEEAELAQTKVDFEEVQKQRRSVQTNIRVELELAKEEKQTKKEDYFAKSYKKEQTATKKLDTESKMTNEIDESKLKLPADIDASKFELTNEIDLLQRKLSEKRKLLATITPVVEHMNNINIFSLKKRKQRRELKSVRERLTKDIVLLEKAIDLLQKHFD